jgi:cephalosporin-C deacetylase-like acetyl esterase
MASYGGRRIRAWFSLPKQRASNRPLPAVMTAPGYSGNKPIPVHFTVAGYAVLTLFPTAQG